MPPAGRRRTLEPSPETTPTTMIEATSIDELARRLSTLVPEGLRDARADLEQNFRAALRAGLSKFDLVTREEYEVQRAVLMRTREKLDGLERQLSVLETRLDSLTRPGR